MVWNLMLWQFYKNKIKQINCDAHQQRNRKIFTLQKWKLIKILKKGFFFKFGHMLNATYLLQFWKEILKKENFSIVFTVFLFALTMNYTFGTYFALKLSFYECGQNSLILNLFFSFLFSFSFFVSYFINLKIKIKHFGNILLMIMTSQIDFGFVCYRKHKDTMNRINFETFLTYLL